MVLRYNAVHLLRPHCLADFFVVVQFLMLAVYCHIFLLIQFGGWGAGPAAIGQEVVYVGYTVSQG